MSEAAAADSRAKNPWRTIIALDTCFEACSVAVGTNLGGDAQRIFSRHELMTTGQAERIIPMVRDVMTEAGLPMAAIDLVAVTTGPGSFTGTRIGIAAGKGLAFALGRPLAGLTSLHVMARQIALRDTLQGAPPTARACDICVAADMGRGEVVAQVFDSSGLAARGAPVTLAYSEIEAFSARAGASLFGRGKLFMHNEADTKSQLSPFAETLVVQMTQCNGKLHPVSTFYSRPPDAKPSRPDAAAERSSLS